MVCFLINPVTPYAQEIREMPAARDIGPRDLLSPPNRRIPDQFFGHDRVRDKVRDGVYVSLSIIRKKIQKEYPGRIVDVQLLIAQREGLRDLFDVKVLTDEGKLLSIKVDAQSAKIVDVKG